MIAFALEWIVLIVQSVFYFIRGYIYKKPAILQEPTRFRYQFYEDHFVYITSVQESGHIPYSAITQVQENGSYLFIYDAPGFAISVDKRTLTGITEEGLRDLLGKPRNWK